MSSMENCPVPFFARTGSFVNPRTRGLFPIFEELHLAGVHFHTLGLQLHTLQPRQGQRERIQALEKYILVTWALPSASA